MSLLLRIMPLTAAKPSPKFSPQLLQTSRRFCKEVLKTKSDLETKFYRKDIILTLIKSESTYDVFSELKFDFSKITNVKSASWLEVKKDYGSRF